MPNNEPNKMKKSLLVSVLCIGMLFSCKEHPEEVQKLPRVAIAGIGIESSTFSPAQTHEEAFHARIGDSIFGRYDFFDEASDFRNRAEWIPTLLGKSLPGD